VEKSGRTTQAKEGSITAHALCMLDN